MAKPFGTVIVEDRNLYRGWFYKLETAPYEIKLLNNNIIEASKVKFFARNNIEIVSGDYMPDTGYVDLQINASAVACLPPTEAPVSQFSSNTEEIKFKNFDSQLLPNPNTGIFTIKLENPNLKDVSLTVYDILGKPIYTAHDVGYTFEINLPNLASGLYIVKLTAKNYSEILKFIKK